MAYVSDNLTCTNVGGLVFGSSPPRHQRVWSYTTGDALAAVVGAGYFNSAASLLAVGDVIRVVGGIGGTQAGEHYHVTVNTGSAVTVVAVASGVKQAMGRRALLLPHGRNRCPGDLQ
jgi:hypothetical protein